MVFYYEEEEFIKSRCWILNALYDDHLEQNLHLVVSDYSTNYE